MLQRLFANQPQFRLSALLAAAIAVVGISASALVTTIALQRFESDTRSELRTLASLAALQVDAGAHESLTRPEHMASPQYQAQNLALAAVKERLEAIRFIYTLRKLSSGQWVFVLDPTPPGDADGDGLPEKSNLMDPCINNTFAMRETLKTGQPQVEGDLVTDQWGTYLSAYAPIRDETGQVVAILGVDRDVSQLRDQRSQMAQAGIWAAVLSVLIAVAFAAILGPRLSRAGGPANSLRAKKSLFSSARAAFLELVLLALTGLVVVAGIYAYGLQGSLGDQVAALDREARTIDRAQHTLGRIMTRRAASAEDVAQLEVAVSSVQSPSLSVLVDKLELARDGQQRISTAAMLAAEMLSRETARADQRGKLLTRLESTRALSSTLMLIAVLLASGALLIVRIASRQQQELLVAEEDLLRHLGEMRQISDNVPIGFFIVREGAILNPNREFDRIFLRLPDEPGLDAWRRAIHRHDYDGVMETLMRAAEQGVPVDMRFRTELTPGVCRSLEMRAVPIVDAEGNYEHLLGFVIDITSRERANQLLEERSAEVEHKNSELTKAYDDLEFNFEAMVRSLVKAVEAKDPYTAGHSERVMEYSLKIGRRLNLTPSEMRVLQMGTLIHDIGKIGIPDAVLTKPSRLTDDEYALIAEHPVIGAQMVQGIPLFRDCVPIILWHHERLDGSGYPEGRRGDEIPLLVRITSIADAFDAMTSDRAYRKGLPAEEALRRLAEDADANLLDPRIVQILADIVHEGGVLAQARPLAA